MPVHRWEYNLTVREVEITPEMFFRGREAMTILVEMANEYFSSVCNSSFTTSGHPLVPLANVESRESTSETGFICAGDVEPDDSGDI